MVSVPAVRSVTTVATVVPAAFFTVAETGAVLREE
jgi:hypothetical protein